MCVLSSSLHELCKYIVGLRYVICSKIRNVENAAQIALNMGPMFVYTEWFSLISSINYQSILQIHRRNSL